LPAAKRLPQREQSHYTTATDTTTEFSFDTTQPPFDTVRCTTVFFAAF
jgi:hypothetical protein